MGVSRTRFLAVPFYESSIAARFWPRLSHFIVQCTRNASGATDAAACGGVSSSCSRFCIAGYKDGETPPVQPVVGSSGLEPPTSRLSGVRSNHLSYEPMSVAVRGPAIPAYLLSVVTLLFALSSFSRRSHCVAALFFRLNASYSVREMLGASRGGDEQNRTVEPLLARQVLSQLSYTPMLFTGRRLHFVKVPCETLKIKQCAELKVLPTDVNVCLTLDYVLSNMSP